MSDVPEVLFVCVHNAGRSQMAAALLDHIAGDRIHVRSAGSDPADTVNPAVIEAMKEVGVDVSKEFPKPLTDEVARAADVIVTMGCGDACPIFPGKRYEDWQIEDPAGKSVEEVRVIRDEIERRVTALAAELTSSVPIACSLEGSDMPDRMAEWHAVLVAVVARRAVPGGIRLTFSPEVPLTEVARLAAAEHDCCRFFSFAITVDERGNALEVRAPDDAQSMVEAVFGTA